MEIFLSIHLGDMAYLFIGLSKCSLVQRGGESKSEAVQVKLPRQHHGRKRALFFKHTGPAAPLIIRFSFYGNIERIALKIAWKFPLENCSIPYYRYTRGMVVGYVWQTNHH